ncbi:MAG: DUF2142 domain-containing protein, partial [Acidimicrobiales bacterium]|nr:DUF2142 domain-containing protein [Acidimicrobiales bacterium]
MSANPTLARHRRPEPSRGDSKALRRLCNDSTADNDGALPRDEIPSLDHLRPLPQTLADRIRRSFEGDGLVELPRFERWSRFAIALAMVWVIFAGAYQALAAGPYNVRDEQAHVGYAMSLSSGRIPSLDTPTRVPPTSPALVERLAETERADGVLTPYQKVWVANHPPGAYLPALPGVWLGRAIGSGNTVLFALRMSNVFGFALTVLVTALLAREVTRRTAAGVVAAAAVAAVPYLQNVTSWAMTDGMTLAVTTAVVWAAVRALRRGFDANSTIVLAALSVACGLTRLTAVATAAVVVAVALVVHAWRNRTFPWKPAVAIGGAVAALSGWFWVWNLQRYGDLAGGHELYERFNRESTGSVTSTLTTRRFWNQLLTTIFEHPIDWAPEWRGRYTPLTTGVLVVAAIGLFALVDRIRPNDDVDRPLSGAEHPNRALSG